MLFLRRFSLLVALILIVSGCESNTSNTTLAGATTSTTTANQTDPTASTTTSPPPITELPGTEGLPQEVRDELLALVNLTQDLRELSFIEPPLISVVTEAELEARVRAQIEEEAEDFPVDEALYQLLGLLSKTADLATLLSDLYGEQVAGFYDGETGELVVPIRDDGFSPVQKATMVHELTHSLTDQNFDFHAGYQAMFDEQRYDEASAYQALIEGDASLNEVLYLQTLSQTELGEFFAEALQAGTGQLDAAPRFLQETLIFPYDTGLAFVQGLYLSDGWDSVDEAYGRLLDLPGSTEQIITPDDYGRDLPIDVRMPDITVPGYTLEENSVWGEFGLRVMFGGVMDEEATLTAADGWGGDRYSLWYDGTNAAFLILYEGDTGQDLEETRIAFLEYATTNIPDAAFAWVEVINDQLAFIASDIPAVGEGIRDSLKS